MIPRCIIRRKESRDQEFIDIAWYSQHPGDQVEQSIKQKIQNSEHSISVFYSLEGRVIFIKWFERNAFGIALVLNSLFTDLAKINIDAYEWMMYIKAIIETKISDWESLMQIYSKDLNDKRPSKIEKIPKYEWFVNSIKGGDVIFDVHSDTLTTEIANLFGFQPWTIFFIEIGKIEKDKIVIKYSQHRGTVLPIDEIFENKIQGDLDSKFWKLIYQNIIDLQHKDPDERWEFFCNHLHAVYELTKEYEPLKLLDMVEKHKRIIPQISSEFISSTIYELISAISNLPPSFSVCERLLNFSQLLVDLEFTDLAKLTEGTALEIVLRLDNPEQKEKIIMELTSRSSQWGEQHIIGFIQTLTGLLSDTDVDKTILSKVTKIVEDELKRSWDGILCLVETNIIANDIDNAIKLRFEATKKIGDKVSHAEDIISAIIWALELEITEERLFAISRDYLREALDILGSIDTLYEQIDVLTQACIQFSKIEYLENLIRFLGNNINLIDQEMRSILVDRIYNQLENRDNLQNISIELKLLHIRVLTQKHPEILPPDVSDQLYKLVGQIYNIIDPSSTNAINMLNRVTENIIEEAIPLGNWSLIEEATRRFKLMADENTNDEIQRMYLDAAIRRSEKPAGKLKQNDIGIRLFNQATTISDLESDPRILDYLPSMKELAIKSRSYSSFTNFIILEIQLRHKINQPWITQMIKDIKILISKGHAVDANLIFIEALELELTSDEEYEILTEQLNLVEREPDLITAEEIYNKRMRVLKLINESEDLSIQQIIDNYRNGVSELISKGDTIHLNDMLLDALSYATENSPESVSEFREIFFDSYRDSILDYKNLKSEMAYNRALSMIRNALEKIENIGTTLLIEMIISIIEVNLDLFYDENKNHYLRKSQLISKEIALYKKSFQTAKISKEQRNELQRILNNLFDNIRQKHPEFGSVEVMLEGAVILPVFDLEHILLSQIDNATNELKQSSLGTDGGISNLILALLTLSDVYMYSGAEENDSLCKKLASRGIKLCNFIVSFTENTEFKKLVRDHRNSLEKTPHQAFSEFSYSIGQYINFIDNEYI